MLVIHKPERSGLNGQWVMRRKGAACKYLWANGMHCGHNSFSRGLTASDEIPGFWGFFLSSIEELVKKSMLTHCQFSIKFLGHRSSTVPKEIDWDEDSLIWAT